MGFARLEIAEDDGHFDPDSLFYNYLPKLSYDYHNDFYESYVELYPDKIDKIKLLLSKTIVPISRWFYTD